MNTRFEWLENSIFGDAPDQHHYVTIFMRADLTDPVRLPPTHVVSVSTDNLWL